MDQQRKEIIVKEIKYWKESHLLPEQYCNFLLTLYTEGTGEVTPTKETRNRVKVPFKSILFHFWMYFLISQLLITVLVIYFTEMEINLQIGLVTFFFLHSIGAAIYLYQKENMKWFHVTLVAGALISFIASVHFTVNFARESIFIQSFVVLLNCASWVSVGLKLKLKYLIISGIVGTIIMISYLFF